MPIDANGQCVPFTAAQIVFMNIKSPGVRDGSHPTETREIDASTARRKFFCKWTERYNFIELVLGNVSVWDDSGTSKLSRLVPDEKYGRMPAHPEIVATKLESMTGFKILGIDYDTGLPEYDQAECTFLYEHVGYDLLPDDQVSDERFRYTQPGDSDGEFKHLTMPGSILHYIREDGTGQGIPVPHKQTIPYNIAFVTAIEQFSYVWKRVPEEVYKPGSLKLYERIYGDPDFAGRPWAGCVNSRYFMGRPMGTVMFGGVEPKRMRSVLGTGWTWDIKFKFAFDPQGWNWLRWFPPKAADAATAGVYFVGKGDTHYFSDTLPDNYSLYNARPLELLWSLT